MNSLSKTLSALTAVGLLSALSAGASAQTVAKDTVIEPPARTIDVSDFDLRSTEDAQAVYNSIRRAARSVCISIYGSWSIKGASFQRVSCIRDAVERAVSSVDMPALTDLHRGTSERELVASR